MSADSRAGRSVTDNPGRVPVERLRYDDVSETAQSMLDAEGESGRFEFKQEASAVDPAVLVAAANWVAREPSREKVVLLVGVKEHEDPATGLVTGEVIGVKSIDQAKHSIRSRCSETKPVPVGLTIIEEGVKTAKPFLRLEIRPTSPPHYDGKGRRVTRDGASTRALTDEELLDFYLDREAEKFEQRFQQTAGVVLARLAQVAEGIEEVSSELGSASIAAWEAASQADDSRSVARRIEDELESLGDYVEVQAGYTLPHLYFELQEMRKGVWAAFAADATARPTKATDRLLERLRVNLERAIDPDNWAMNLTELQFWQEVLERRGGGTTMTGWLREIKERDELVLETGMSLTNDIAQLRLDIDRARAERDRT